MGLTTKKEEQLKKMPLIETRVRKSKDGRYLVHQTIISYIRPVNYYQAIMDDKESVETVDVGAMAKSAEA